jgi:hypothetical protein
MPAKYFHLWMLATLLISLFLNFILKDLKKGHLPLFFR